MPAVSRSKMLHAKTTLHASLNKKYSSRSNLKVGVIMDAYTIHYLDSVRNENNYEWSELLNANSNPLLARAYASWKYRLKSNLTLNVL